MQQGQPTNLDSIINTERKIIVLFFKLPLSWLHLTNKNCVFCFVDLTKAYDKIPQKNLFEVLMHELKIDKSILKCLMHMYTNIKASVCVIGTYGQAFTMHEGLR